MTLHDRLSQLTFVEASKLLGARGEVLIRRGGAIEVDVLPRMPADAERFSLTVPVPRSGTAIVTFWLANDRPRRLRWRCSACASPCDHVGAAFSVVLEDKVALGLAEPPPETADGAQDLVARAFTERTERARTEKMTIRAVEPSRPWSDYTVTSAESGRTYRVALRSEQRGDSYCSCPDFRKNTLGTCKHILYVLDKIRRRFPAAVRAKPYVRRDISVHLRYGEQVELRISTPAKLPADAAAIVSPVLGHPVSDVRDLVRRVARLERAGHTVTVYPDAEEYIQSQMFRDRIRARVEEIRADPANHPLRRELLCAELLPYQLDGIAFAVGAGRAVLADDMGLGKTIQAIGVAELLAREAEIKKVLIVCPASVKAQWRGEIERFSQRSCQIVLGTMPECAAQYAGETFFSICNYEQVLRDLRAIERSRWDLIVLDEGQRIKNWEAKTSDTIKRLRSRFALVLSGTPLENRLDELYSVVEFIDDRRLGRMDDLKRRLELLLGAKPDAPVDESERARKEQEVERAADRKQRLAEAGGRLVAAALELLGELLPRSEGAQPAQVSSVLREQLAGALDTDATGRPILTLTLPDRSALDNIAQSLASLMARGAGAAVLN
ncbi:MAG: hypothetical protein E6J90_43645 [Deltaproteobacteria bacterium]|nr:MAG: hypothetical protein E6J90_43645 [Deltaproteobacteria bacterium]